ncbi:ANTH domain-containing protein [Phycomyces nitens]|nr:ANTH domain-containing protein [Phycomyces nitens]
MQTAVRKATRLEYKPPKEKHIKTLIGLTFQNPASIPDIIHALEKRLQENSWIITIKVLIILHTLMREGNEDKVLKCISKDSQVLDIGQLREKSTNSVAIQNIRVYKLYLDEKVECYRDLKIDFVRATSGHNDGRLRHLPIANGLLKETKVLQKQIGAIVKCKFHFDEGDNSLSFQAYRLVINDLLVLFKAVNEGVVNILEHYFAMNRTNARISLDIYKKFALQTELIINYLNEARKLQRELDMAIPVGKHAPLSLAEALEEYLLDLEKKSKTPSRRPSQASRANTDSQPTQPAPLPATQPAPQSFAPPPQPPQPQPVSNPPDFFGPLANEQTMVYVPAQQTGSIGMGMQQPFLTGQQNPLPITPNITGNSNNPFRASMVSNNAANGTWTSTLATIPQFTRPEPFQPSTNLSRSATTIGHSSSMAGHTGRNSSNPFRASTIGHPRIQSEPWQNMHPMTVQTTGFGPQPLMTGAPMNKNPFAPASPPLTPHKPTNITNNQIFTVSPTAMASPNNPFAALPSQAQQNNAFNSFSSQ